MKFGKKAAHSGAKRSLVLVVSVLVLLLAVAGGTLAWLTAQDSVTNTFSPAYVTCDVAENFENGIKSGVKIKNTSNIPAYIRAYIVVTWKDADGNVYGQKPVEGEDKDYTMEIPRDTAWVTGSDGYYYYTSPVAVDGSTGVLISECKPVAGKAPNGYNLSVEIIAEAIQSVPTTTVEGVWGPTVTSVAPNGTLTVN